MYKKLIFPILLLLTFNFQAWGTEEDAVRRIEYCFTNSVSPLPVMDSIILGEGTKEYYAWDEDDLERDTYFIITRNGRVEEIDYLTLSREKERRIRRDFTFLRTEPIVDDSTGYTRVGYYEGEKLYLEIWHNIDQVLELKFREK